MNRMARSGHYNNDTATAASPNASEHRSAVLSQSQAADIQHNINGHQIRPEEKDLDTKTDKETNR